MRIKREIAKYKISQRKRQQEALAKAERKVALRENALRKQSAIEERKAKLAEQKAMAFKQREKELAARRAKLAKAAKTGGKIAGSLGKAAVSGYKALDRWANKK